MIAGAFLPAGAQADGQPLLLPGAYVGLEGGYTDLLGTPIGASTSHKARTRG
jgi:hypothetical protein